jgi:hypothetical protein
MRIGNRPTLAEQNLTFVLLAALGDGLACTCTLAQRVHSSSAAFLSLPRERIAREIDGLTSNGFVTAFTRLDCPQACTRAFRISDAGRRHLASTLEMWRLSRLAGAAIHPEIPEVKMIELG